MNTLLLPNSRIHTGNLILVNGQHGFAGLGQEEDRLMPLQEHLPHIKMQRRAAVLLSNLMEDIDGWRHIMPVSGWRSLEEQQGIWDDTLAKRGLPFTQKYVALPGHSEHETGLAMDLGLKQENIDFIRPDFPYSGICQLFRKKAAAYGFIERYPAGKEHITGIGHEPWHFRYVGIPHGEIMMRNQLTLEEYMAFIKEYPYGQKAHSIQLGGKEVLVSYLKAAQVGSTKLEMDGSGPYSVSGNNIDGFIMTEWRQINGYKTELRRA